MSNLLNNELFIEIMCEKLPIVEGVNKNLRSATMEALNSYENAEKIKIETFVTANRLVVIMNNCPEFLQPKSKQIKGPKTTTDNETVMKFFAKHGCDITNGIISNGFYYIKQDNPSIKIKEEAVNIVNTILTTMTWPEYMRWDSGTKWIRPIRRIVTVFSESPIIFYSEIAKLKSSPSSLYVLTEDDEFVFAESNHYFKALSERFIFIKDLERSESVQNQIRYLLNRTDLSINVDSYKMINEILACTESPFLYLSKYDGQFNLPDHIKQVVMTAHQKYIPLFDKNKKLSQYFLVHSNYKLADEGKALQADSAWALEARFTEAEYFWEEDLKLTEKQHFDMLHKTLLHNELGSLSQQIARLEFMSAKFKPESNILRNAAHYVNIDLSMQTTFELPELHGIVSGLYAKQHGYIDQNVAVAIQDSLYPKHDEHLPNDLSIDGAYLGFLLRLDKIVGFFGKNIIPKGSSDTFGLRRSSFGLLKLGYFIKDLPSLTEMINHCIKLYYDQGIKLINDVEIKIMDFLTKRLEVLLDEISPKFGRLFARNQITWLEMDRLKHFLVRSSEYTELQKIYKRIGGMIGSHRINHLPSTRPSYQPIAQLFKVLAAYNPNPTEELNYFVELSKLVTQLLDKTYIQDLDNSTQKETIDLLSYAYYLLNNYCSL